MEKLDWPALRPDLDCKLTLSIYTHIKIQYIMCILLLIYDPNLMKQ